MQASEIQVEFGFRPEVDPGCTAQQLPVRLKRDREIILYLNSACGGRAGGAAEQKDSEWRRGPAG